MPWLRLQSAAMSRRSVWALVLAGSVVLALALVAAVLTAPAWFPLSVRIERLDLP